MTVIWCWFIMSTISLCIAASLGEIASRYPTSGGGEFSGRFSRSLGWVALVLTVFDLVWGLFSFGDGDGDADGSVLLELHDGAPEIQGIDELCGRLVIPVW